MGLGAQPNFTASCFENYIGLKTVWDYGGDYIGGRRVAVEKEKGVGDMRNAMGVVDPRRSGIVPVLKKEVGVRKPCKTPEKEGQRSEEFKGSAADTHILNRG